MLEDYMATQTNTQELSRCNTEKTQHSINNKCKTRGVVLAVHNCGIVLSFREIYGAESLTQVCFFYLDTLSNYKGNING